MSRSSFPPVSALVPHSGPMSLLDQVLEHSRERTVCSVDPAGSRLFAEPDGRVPVWLGLEYMAQCIAAHGGLAARALGEPPRPGLFLGTRRVEFGTEYFQPQETLRVTAVHHRGVTGLVAFDCEVVTAAGGDPLVNGRMNVYIVDDWNALEGSGDDGG
ncbi:MAG: 3-hydroxylacyl-ACP dehydratase [Deltaproteobacteria bacterium]|nr:3-hydroxylacyl-ACP dehydratase [Deltaproteobacteria bacterium]MBW2398688.1 3-hydroxylacyl-ACP dehydratase [Deltaproteobacteria bacterium]MBW2665679.1 3-hydroxylacyl-ACP dehydratase [Deltaproteobacteria bacterium]